MRRLARGAAGLFGTLVVLALGSRLYMERPAADRLRPGEDVAIADLRAPLPSNAFLACPPGYCAIPGAAPSPILAIGIDRLYHDFLMLAAAEPHVVTIRDEPPRRLVLIQRSAVLRFPDIVIAEFIALGPAESSIALYSRARYGRYDFGVNRRRVERWLARLGAIAKAQ